MGIVAAIVLFVCGALAASSLVIAKKPNAKELLDKLVPFQGWIGFVVCLWGLWIVIHALINAGVISVVPVWWVTYLLTGLISAGLGFLLGYGLLSKFILSKNPTAAAKGEEILAKLTKIQIPLGVAGMVWGIWSLISTFVRF